MSVTEEPAPPAIAERSDGEFPISSGPSLPTRISQMLRHFATGEKLDDASFALRHHVALSTAAGLCVLLILIGVRGDTLGHVLFEVSPMAFAIAAGVLIHHRELATLASTTALMIASSLLVHFTDGLIESHFLFFVLLPLVALYQNWKPFALSVGYVLFHHAVVGTVSPEEVYNHEAAQQNPVLWGLIHAVFVAGLIVVLLLEWNFAAETRRLAEERLGELEIAQADLIQAQKLESVGQLAAGIAHEINTPMQYIGDNTHFLKATVTRLIAVAEAAEQAVADDARPAERERLAELIERSKLPMLAERAPKAADDALSGVENVSRIVTAMKRFSHPGSDEMEPLDLNQAITTTMTVCRNEWKYAADIETDLAADLPMVEGKLGQLNQVWLNMIVNATHAIADRHHEGKGLIRISTCHRGDDVTVTIADNGSGIDAQNLSKIFDHFFTTKEVGKGTGQGLSIAHQVIVGEHRGTISVDSVKGEGTTFTITLPVSTAPVSGSEAEVTA